MRPVVKFLPVFLASVMLAGCATNPTSGERIFSIVSPEQESQIGAQQYTQSVKQFGGVNDNARLNEFVARIGARLVPFAERQDVKWTFTVLNSEVVNAFAIPGGYVYITRGLLALAQDESQVAAVLAHEMGHVNARHSAQQMSQGMLANIGLQAIGIATNSNIASQAGGIGADLFMKGYSRQHEYESDALSVRYLAKAGYDPYANEKFLTMLQQYTQLEARMQGQQAGAELFSYFATHPQTGERIIRAKKWADQSVAGKNPIVNRGGYLKAIDGTVYGGNAEQGFIRGQTFIHPDLKIRFDAPNGFTLKNSATKVIAQNTNGAAMIFDMGGGSTNDPAAYLADTWAQGAVLTGLENISVNGFGAATAATQVRTNEGTKDARLVAYSAGNNRFYRLAFLTQTGQMNVYATEFRSATYSFNRLSGADARQAQPHRVRVITAKAGDTIQSLAAAMPVKDFAVERFCLLNALTPNDALTPGLVLKTVE